jgi:hypothetical protein
MIRESIHKRLKEVYDEFDNHCRINNVGYSVDADYCNVQGYRLLDCNDVPGFLRHMSNFVKDRDVNLNYDGAPVDYDRLRENDFSVNTYNPLFMFTLKPLQEKTMPLNEEQYKDPTRSHTLKQAQFRDSFEEHDTPFTYKRKKKKKKKKSSDLANEEKFEDRLQEAIQENIVTAVDPDILFIRNPAEPAGDDTEEVLQDALQAESVALSNYLVLLENAKSDGDAYLLEGMVEKCTANINQLRNLIKDK